MRAEHLLGAQLLARPSKGHFAHGRFAALCRHDYIFRRRDASGWCCCLLGQSHAGKMPRKHQHCGAENEICDLRLACRRWCLSFPGGLSAASKGLKQQSTNGGKSIVPIFEW
jgi:hypothetical protein